MSGHSKWNNIKRKKEKTDAQKAKVFTKIGREMSVVIREGGADPANNTKLRDLIAKAKSLNVPNDNINRVIKRAQGGEKDDYEKIVYEGYGPCGIAVMVETLTDNRNRTAANMRHYFDKYGGNLGQSGSVAFQFNQKGVLVLESEDFDEEALMEDVFEAGAEDFDLDDTVCEVTTASQDLQSVRSALALKNYNVVSAELEQVPESRIEITGEDNIKNFSRLLSHLEEDEDVQEIWYNIDNEEDLDD